MYTFFAVALGGALGSVARHGANILGLKMLGDGFPYATLVVNIIGSMIMGLLIGIFAHFWQPPQEMRAFLVTGFLGGLTTFSTFSLDVVTLYERGEWGLSILYIILSVAVSVAALFSSLYIVRSFAS